MGDKAHIVVVDDEADLREMLHEYLSAQGFSVSVADGGSALRSLIEERPADLVVLDVNMPGDDGLTLTRFLRERGGTGIILLTAVGETVDRIVGLEMGADDYLPKPFDPRELLARIKSVLRRSHMARLPAAPAARPGEVRFGRYVLNLESHKLLDSGNVEIQLTSSEFDLLKVFAAHPNQVLSRDRLLDLTSHRDLEPFDRSIDVRITRIRRKIEVDAARPQVIKTVRGSGYMFVCEI
jgi:two-component system phosphate regulon response regulator OmpR